MTHCAQLRLGALGFARWPNGRWNDCIYASWETEDLHVSRLGRMSASMCINRAVLDHNLRDDLIDRGIAVRNERMGRLTRTRGTWSVPGLAISARFVIDATGSSAAIARHLTKERTFGRSMAIIAATTQPRDNDWYDGNLLVEAGGYGWWYSLVAHIAVVAFTTTPAALRALRPQQLFASRLAQTRYIRHRLTKVDDVRTIARPGQILGRVVDDGWIAVGDAAAPSDPLAGTGIERAIETSTAAAATVIAGMCEDARRAYTWRVLSMRQSDALNRAALSRRVMYRDEPYWKEQRGEDSTILPDVDPVVQRLPFDAGDSSAA